LRFTSRHWNGDFAKYSVNHATIQPQINADLDQAIAGGWGDFRRFPEIMMADPLAFLDILRIRAGTMAGVGRLVVEPQLPAALILNELLAQCDASAPMSDENHVWLDSGPIGSELL
jgi:antitoxin ChpS